MKDTLKNPGITKKEIKSAREFAELKPDTKAAQKLLEFLESLEVKETLIYVHPDVHHYLGLNLRSLSLSSRYSGTY